MTAPDLFPAARDLLPGDDLNDDEAKALAEWHAWWCPQWTAIAEGFCPKHRIPLEPVDSAPGWVGGHCTPCRAYWGDDRDGRNVRWTLDHKPWHHDEPVRPEWVLA